MVSAITNARPASSPVDPGTTGVEARCGCGTIRLMQALGRKLDPRDPQVVRETAAQLLSELFLKPTLAEMRQFPFGRELATGGQTESIFGELLDERVADRVAASERGLTAGLIEQLESRARRTAARMQSGRETSRGEA